MTKTLHSLHLNIVSYCELSILHKWMQVISNGNYSIRYIFRNTQLQNGQSIGPVSPTTAVIVCPLSCFVTKIGVTLLTIWLLYYVYIYILEAKRNTGIPEFHDTASGNRTAERKNDVPARYGTHQVVLLALLKKNEILNMAVHFYILIVITFQLIIDIQKH